MKTSKTIQKIYQELRDSRDDEGRAAIDNTTVAKLLRVRLRHEFPGVAFRVRCSRGDAIHVDWTDGPVAREVDSIVGQYTFGGFDGMIDLAYYSDNWLLPDGSMVAASSCGTEGSRGTVPGYTSDCPDPGAILVQYGPKYIFTQRDISADRWMQLIRLVEDRYGFEFDESKSTHSQYVENYCNDPLPTVCRKLELELADRDGNLPQPEPREIPAGEPACWTAWL